jgi:hypothetical protein
MKIVRNRYFDKLVCDLDMRRIHRTTNITTNTHTIIAIEEVVIIVFFSSLSAISCLASHGHARFISVPFRKTGLVKQGRFIIFFPSPPWLAMLVNVSVGYPPQMRDIFVCRRHVGNVVSTHWCYVGQFFSCRRRAGVTSFPTHFPTCT